MLDVSAIENTLVFRKYNYDSDYPFIASSITYSLVKFFANTADLNTNIFNIINNNKINIVVAADKEEPTAILGYIVTNKDCDTLIYAYVKHSLRQYGIFNAIKKHINAKFVYYTLYGMKSKIINTKYNLISRPYILLNYSKDCK